MLSFNLYAAYSPAQPDASIPSLRCKASRMYARTHPQSGAMRAHSCKALSKVWRFGTSVNPELIAIPFDTGYEHVTVVIPAPSANGARTAGPKIRLHATVTLQRPNASLIGAGERLSCSGLRAHYEYIRVV